jgi:predicted glycogen debranching enzyme
MPAVLVLHFGREVCGDSGAALRRQWTITNGLGGYATAALDGTPIRRYSGWLIAALQPPVARTVLVGGLLETAATANGSYELGSLERAGRGFHPSGGRHLESFELDGLRPTWVFALGATRLERLAWMAQGANTTYIRYRVLRGVRVDLEVVPLVTFRDHHQLRPMDGRGPAVSPVPGGLEVRWEETPVVTRLLGPGAVVAPLPEGAAEGWVRGIAHRVETERGLDDVTDLAVPGRFRVTLAEGESWTLILTVEPTESVELDAEAVLAGDRARDVDLLARAAAAGTDVGDPLVSRLVLAADQFIVARPVPGEETTGRSVIAGYPWFNDWGRDTMIALPGLCLVTGRADDAARILRSFGPMVRRGLLPNSFPDAERTEPGYHTVDAALWYVHAVRAYLEATGDERLVDELLPTLRDIVEHHVAGTDFEIRVDPSDGLLRAGVPGVQLTWMDAKAGDWVVTPRIGKPVEIQALWVHACRTVAGFSRARGRTAEAERFAALAERAATSFRARFWDPARGYLRDVVDGPEGDSWQLRPNQLLAVSLELDLVPAWQAALIVDTTTRALWTGCGLRSLAPGDPAYIGAHTGDRLARDAAYHQGTSWSWLIGPWAEALLRTGTPGPEVRALLEPFASHLRDDGVGSISECFDGDPPHRPTACHAQAWGVAEVLRVLRLAQA